MAQPSSSGPQTTNDFSDPQIRAPFPWDLPCWRDGIIRHQLGANGSAHLVTGTILGVLVTAVLIWSPWHDWMARTICLVFIALGFGNAIWGLVLLARWQRFSKCHVRMKTLPGLVGGYCAGELVLPASGNDKADVFLELVCEASVLWPKRHSNNDTSTSVDKAWSVKRRIRTGDFHLQDEKLSIPFEFVIPYGLHDETEKIHDENNGTITTYQWYLQATARIPGADLDLKFHMPVFKTPQSDPGFVHVPDPDGSLPLEQSLEEKGETLRVQVEGTSEGPAYCVGIDSTSWKALVPLSLASLTTFGIAFGLMQLGGLSWNADSGQIELLGEDTLFRVYYFLGALSILGLSSLYAFLVLRELTVRRTWIANGYTHQTREILGFLPLPDRHLACTDVGSVSADQGTPCRHIAINPRRQWSWIPVPSLSRFFKTDASIIVATGIPTRCEAEAIHAELQELINQFRQSPVQNEPDDDKAFSP